MQAFLSRAAVKLSQNRRTFSTDSGSMTRGGTRAPRSPLVRASLRGRPWVRALKPILRIASSSVRSPASSNCQSGRTCTGGRLAS